MLTNNYIQFFRKSYLLLAGMFSFLCSAAQVSVAGPQCVKQGTIYQYEIKGYREGNRQFSICVEGGVIAGNDSTCIEAFNGSFIRVQWTEQNQGSITVTSAAGNAVYNVHCIPGLQGGSISSIKKQFIDYNKKPAALTCSPATGGSCQPQYKYQWQQSTDFIKWEDIPGATSPSVTPSRLLTETTFFRRKVIDNSSGSVAFSDAVAVYVYADLEGHQ